MNYSDIISQLLVVIAGLVTIVNIVTEVAKKAFEIKSAKIINIFVTILSIVLTFLATLSYWQIKNLPLHWYVYIAFVIVGFMVAYAAMFGYDKLLSYFKKEQEN